MFNLFKKKEARNLQDEFDVLITKIVFPVFKENNFKKKGNNFNRKTQDMVQFFDVQKSQWNSKENVSFTFNIGFYSEKVFKEIESSDISDFPKMNDCFLQTRVGHIFYGTDKWFDINQNTNTLELEKEILKVMQETMIFFNNHMNLISIKDVADKYGSNVGIFGFNKVAFLITVNEKEESEKLLKELYAKILEPWTSTNTIRYPDGSTKEETIYPSDDSIKIQKGWMKKYKDFAHKHDLKLD